MIIAGPIVRHINLFDVYKIYVWYSYIKIGNKLFKFVLFLVKYKEKSYEYIAKFPKT